MDTIGTKKKLNGSKNEGFHMKHDGTWLTSSTRIIEDFDQALEVLETSYRAHVAVVGGLTDWPEDVITQWYVEAVSKAT